MKQLDLFQPPPRDVSGGGNELPGAPADAEGPGAAHPDAPPTVLIAGGAMAAEEALLARLEDLAAVARRDPRLLALPVRVVVPSRSLRRHLAARLVRRSPPPAAVQPGAAGAGALAGVTVQTAYGLACEVLERAGRPAPRGALLFATLVEREARREALLRGSLGDLEDGFLSVAATVGELLDAGLEPAHAEAVDEALATDGPRAASRAAVARARAVARVAVRTENRLRELGVGRRSTLLRRAAEELAASPETALPARAILLHGFVTAAGAAGDLLLALLRRPGALLVLDRPAAPGALGAGVVAAPGATARLAELAAGVAAPRPWQRQGGAKVRLAASTAIGVEAEARAVAGRLRRLLDGGDEASPAPAPESLAVVGRDLGPYRVALRRHLRRLGVPFSGVGERGGALPSGRRAAAVLDLLHRGVEATADRWLDAWESISPAERVDLRLALHALGAARLRDVAALRERTFEKGFALPIRHGLGAAGRREHAAPVGAAIETAVLGAASGTSAPVGAAIEPSASAGDAAEVLAPGLIPGPANDDLESAAPDAAAGDEDGEGRAVARRRRIPERRLRRGIQAACRVHDRLVERPVAGAARDQIAWLRGLLRDLGLGGGTRSLAASPLGAAIEELESAVPADLELLADDLRQLLARALGGGGEVPIGGEGGGVQVLSVAEARGRTFDHLFLIGLNRDVFPRPLREDPLLPDDLRRVVQRVLPDLALRRGAVDDERHAFAQLLSAAPAVSLSWRVADDDGKPLAVSPLVERLLPDLDVTAAPPLYSPALPGVRPADEHAVLAGLHGTRAAFGLLLPIALGAVREEWGRPLLDLDAAAIAALGAARARILDEMDPDLRTAAGRAAAARLGPYLGFVGPVARRPAHQLYVTHLETLAACPWQLFLGRLLRIERPPDPLALLAGADPLRLGNVVHRALDRIVRSQLPGETPADGAERSAGASGGDGPAVANETVARLAAGALGPAEGRAFTARFMSAVPGGGGAAPVAVRWPAPKVLAPLVLEVAAEVLAEEGVELPGLARALAESALPYVEAAGRLDWPGEGATVAVVGSEVEGELALGQGPLRLRFRADREDFVDGRRRFTDYKTGKPISSALDAAKVRSKLLAEMRAGRRLQVAAYLLAAGAAPASGRYLFLRPPPDAPALPEVVLESADREAGELFGATVDTLIAAWEQGSFFPRVVDPAGRQEPARCAFCDVAEACVRGDSGARARLREWASRARAAPPPAGTPEAAFLALWDLPAGAEDPAAEAPPDGAAPESR